MLNAIQTVNGVAPKLGELQNPAGRQDNMCTFVSPAVTSELIRKVLVLLGISNRQLYDRNANSMTLFLNSIYLIQVILVEPVLVGRPQKADALNVACLLVESEHYQLVNRNVNPTLVGLDYATLEVGRNSSREAIASSSIDNLNRRCPHVDRNRTAIKVIVPFLDIHGMPGSELLPDNLALCPWIIRHILAVCEDLLKHVVAKVEHQQCLSNELRKT